MNLQVRSGICFAKTYTNNIANQVTRNIGYFWQCHSILSMVFVIVVVLFRPHSRILLPSTISLSFMPIKYDWILVIAVFV